MKKIFVLLICLMTLAGCAPSEGEMERAQKNRIDKEIQEVELYKKAYEDGYMDAVEATVDIMPWFMVDVDELEEALYKIFGASVSAEEIRDLILSECEVYSREDFKIYYSDSGMDFY